MTIAWGVPLAAPAKLNLFLHVIGRRADGYHLLQTVFRFIDFSDELTFLQRSDAAIRLESPLPGVPEEANLIVRAARALQAAARVERGVTIRVTKRIPMGGGLGGGSSDAATTLLALDRLWDTGIGRDRLAALGLALGADVPVFVHGHNAFAEGVGERLTPLDLPPRWYLVLVPQVSVPTGEIFADPTLTRDTEKTTITAFFAAGQQGGETGRHDHFGRNDVFGRNDLEAIVRARFPEVAWHLDWLQTVAAARLTGSGACVFAEFMNESAARSAAARMPGWMTGFVARGFERHPLA